MTDSGEQWVVNNPDTLKNFLKEAEKQFERHGYVVFKWQSGNQRTRKQNSAMWLWLSQLATELNDAGYDMRKTLKDEVDIPWTKSNAKTHLWDPVQRLLFGKDSSQQLEKTEINEVQEVIARHIAKSTGVTVPFPQKD